MHNPRHQRGMVLLGSLILLLVITIIGFSVMETSNLEARMATARELKEIAFQTSEAVGNDDVLHGGDTSAVNLEAGVSPPAMSRP